MAIRSLKTGTFTRSGMAGNPVIMPGSYESIATVDVGSGGSANIDFTSIPTTYQHLQIRGMVRLASSSSNRWTYMRFGNGTIDTGTNYSVHGILGNGTSATIGEIGASTSSMPVGNVPTAAQSSSVFGTFVIDILDYADTNKYKTIRTLIGYDNNGSGVVSFTSGNWRSTAAINTIRLFGSGENTVQYSSFALYGVN